MKPLDKIIIKKASCFRRIDNSYSETYVWAGPKGGQTALFKTKMYAGMFLGVEPIHVRGSMWNSNRCFYLATKRIHNMSVENIDVESEEVRDRVENTLTVIKSTYGRLLAQLDAKTNVSGETAFAKSSRVENGMPDLGTSSGAVAVQWSNDTNCFLTEFSVNEASFLSRTRNGTLFRGEFVEPVRILSVLDESPQSFDALGQTYEQSYEMKYISARRFSHVIQLATSEVPRLAQLADKFLAQAKSKRSWEAPGNYVPFGIIEGCYYHALEDFPIDDQSGKGKTMCIWDDNEVAHHVAISDFDV